MQGMVPEIGPCMCRIRSKACQWADGVKVRGLLDGIGREARKNCLDHKDGLPSSSLGAFHVIDDYSGGGRRCAFSFLFLQVCIRLHITIIVNIKLPACGRPEDPFLIVRCDSMRL